MILMATGARYGLRRALPFVSGVALGKQLIIWPLGLGLAEVARNAPQAFEVMKWAAAAYILYLAWRVAGLKLRPGAIEDRAPGFAAGLIVHPLNPKAWAMIIASFTNFTDPAADPILATATVAVVLLGCQIVFHPIWTYGGEQIAKVLAGTAYETYLMRTLAVLTVASVALVLF